MFNLLMAGDDADWAVEVGEKRGDRFPLTRYLEYTDPSLEERLKPVSAATLASLAELPAAFMSELKSPADDEPFVNLRVGRVSNLAVAGADITYDFTIDVDFGRVPVGDRKAFEALFGLGRWELTRTHWAVKTTDLEEALTALGLATPTTSQPVAAAFDVEQEDAPAAPRADTVERFLELVLAEGPSAGRETFYRGHANAGFRLEPSLFRRNAKGGYRYLPNETVFVREMLTAHPADFAPDAQMIDKLVRMQHYGAPTRLLDITSNPLVALYFACASAADEDEDGEVILLTTGKDEVKFFDSDTVSCIANLAMLDAGDKDSLDLKIGVKQFNATPVGERLLHFIGAEKPYFKPQIDPDDLRRIVFVKGRRSNDRISSQAGAFLLFGQDALLPETGHSALDIRRVAITNKAHILDQLDRMNIKASTIYPGIEKTATELARLYEVLD